jgi:transcriptional regulator with XRE-family HTH domain
MGISQTELAKRTGCAPAYISQIEGGQRKPAVKTLEKLAVSLNVDTSTLLLDIGSDYVKGTVPLGRLISHLLFVAEELKARQINTDAWKSEFGLKEVGDD